MQAPHSDRPPELDTVREDVGQWVEELNQATEEQPQVFEQVIARVETSELALMLESLPQGERLARWQQVGEADRVEVLVNMRGEARTSILRSLEPDALGQVLEQVDAEDLIELSENLPDEWVDRALGQMDARQRNWFEQASQYPDTVIGRYVNHELVMLPSNTRVKTARRAFQRNPHPYTEHAYVVDKQGIYQGAVSLGQLQEHDDDTRLSSLELEAIVPVAADTLLADASDSVEHSGFGALPVVSDDMHLLGRITLRMAIELSREKYEAQLMARVGLDEEADLFLPVWLSAKRRAIWLGINLLTALLASWTIGLFEATISQVVALAVLMPIVASMGGIAGSQTLTLIIRGLAMHQVTWGNVQSLFTKELGVGILNGVLWAATIGLVAGFWFESLVLGGVIGAAIVINILVAAAAGVAIPLLLEKLNMDPALAGSVILTTVTDVVGFFAFLGLGTLLLL